MKIYLINLDRATERLERMTRLFAEHDLMFERFSAVDAQGYSTKEVELLNNRIGGTRPMSLGDLACGESHIACLKVIANGADDFAAVIEDDVHLSDDARLYLKTDDWIPRDTDLIKPETFMEQVFLGRPIKKLSNGRKLSPLLSKHWGTGLYIISKDAARRILDNYTASSECIDVYLFGIMLREFKVYQIHPAIAIQDNIGGFLNSSFLKSDISSLRGDMILKVKGMAKLKREIKRTGRQIKDFFKSIYLRLFKGQFFGKVPYKP